MTKRILLKKSKNYPPYLKEEMNPAPSCGVLDPAGRIYMRPVHPPLWGILGRYGIKKHQPEAKINLEEISLEKPQLEQYIGWVRFAQSKIKVTDSLDWEQKFQDPEDYEGLHRWNWLLVKLSEASDRAVLKEWGRFYIYDWLRKFINQRDSSLKWNTYTTSERICNWLVFREKVALEIDQTIKSALAVMAWHVLNNLEYYGPGGTFNHIINNARALYFYGQYFGAPFYARVAIKIIENELPRLVTQEGFLREGSSHYHFLFTRWLLEIFDLAQRKKDEQIAQKLKFYLEKLLKKCWFFLNWDQENRQWTFPLIGDVSPDFTPGWLIFVPFSSVALSIYRPLSFEKYPKLSGWAKIFTQKGQEDNSFISTKLNKNQNSSPANPQSGWYRFDFAETTLFFHIEPEGVSGAPGHFHDDLCAFSLYRQGRAVLLDCGRLHYLDDDLGRYGLSARSHNGVQLDGRGPTPERKYADLWRNIYQKPQVFFRQNQTSLEFTINHFGFSRLYGEPVSHRRQFKLFPSHLIIEDYFQGNKSHLVESFFHWAPGFSFEPQDEKNQLKVARPGEKMIIEYHSKEDALTEKQFGNLEIPAGWFFPEYGRKIPIWTLTYKTKAVFPLKQSYVIKWN